MRIIRGSLGGRRISPPRGTDIRPTTDMAREALFSILDNRLDLESVRALDLFAGTGAVSFELISRGCPAVTAIEQNPAAVNGIYKLIADWQVSGLTIIRTDVFRYLNKPPQNAFSLVFADPPYKNPHVSLLPSLVMGSGILTSDGIFVLEHPHGYEFAHEPGYHETRRYGNVHFSFFQKENVSE